MPNDQLPPAVEQAFDEQYNSFQLCDTVCKGDSDRLKHFLAQALATQERELLEWVRTEVEKLGGTEFVIMTFGEAETKPSEPYIKKSEVLALLQRRELGERES